MRRATHRLIWVLLVGMGAPALVGAQTPNDWGSDTFDAEEPRYQRAVAERERTFRRISARIAARQKEIDDYLASFLTAGRAAEVERSYENGPYDAADRRDRFETARGSARSAERVYQRSLDAVTKGGLNPRNASTRGPLWYEHLYWLDLRNKAAELEYQMLDSRLVGLRAAAGFDWFEFWADTGDDLTFVFREVARNFAAEVSTCFADLFRKSLTGAFTNTIGMAPTAYLASSGPAQAPTLGSLVDVAGCVTGPAMNTWVNALAAALKKQFLDEMGREGVLEEVAVYWWDTLIAAKDDVTAGFVDSAKKEMFGTDGMLNVLKTHTEQTAARILATEERPAIQKALEPLVSSGQLNKAGARTSALQIAEKRGRDRVGSMVKGLQLGVNLASTAGTLLLNSQTYDGIKTNQLGMYRTIVQCLEKQGRPANASNILPYFRATTTSSYVALVNNCRAPNQSVAEATPPPPTAPAGPAAADVTALLDGVRAQAGAVRSAAADAQAVCGRAADAAKGVAAAWDNVGSAVAALREGIEVYTASLAGAGGADAAAKAEALARDIYAAGEVVSAARTRGIQAATSACQAADALPPAALTERPRLRNQTRQDANSAGQAAADAAAALSRARAALASARSLAPAAPSAINRLDAVRAAEAKVNQALTAAKDAQAGAEAQISQAEAGLVKARELVDAMRGRIEQGRAAGHDSATLGLLEAEVSRAEDAISAAANCPAEARATLADLMARGASVEAEARTSLAAAGQLKADGRPGADAQRIANAIADAQASYDAADLLADSARSAAASAEACRTRAESVPDPAPAPVPTVTPLPPPSLPVGGGGWTSGPTRTNTGVPAVPPPGTATSSQPASPPPVTGGADPRIATLEASIQAAGSACRWTQAADLAEQLAAIDPGNLWLAANRANVTELALRQRQASTALAQGASAVSANDVKGAQAAITHAATVAPACMSGQVTQLVGQARAAADASRQRSAEDRRRGLGSLLQGLTAVQQALNPQAPQSSTPTSLTDLISALGGGNAAAAAAAVAGAGGTGASPAAPPDVRTVTCGATTKSGNNVPATITVQVQNAGNARFSYQMFNVKDRMIVSQGGRTLIDTGCVSGSSTSSLPLNGFGPVVVQVLPACEGSSTNWNFTLGCPQ